MRVIDLNSDELISWVLEPPPSLTDTSVLDSSSHSLPLLLVFAMRFPPMKGKNKSISCRLSEIDSDDLNEFLMDDAWLIDWFASCLMMMMMMMMDWFVRDHYFTTVSWANDEEVMVSWLNRHQNVSMLSFCQVASNVSCKTVSLAQWILPLHQSLPGVNKDSIGDDQLECFHLFWLWWSYPCNEAQSFFFYRLMSWFIEGVRAERAQRMDRFVLGAQVLGRRPAFPHDLAHSAGRCGQLQTFGRLRPRSEIRPCSQLRTLGSHRYSRVERSHSNSVNPYSIRFVIIFL